MQLGLARLFLKQLAVFAVLLVPVVVTSGSAQPEPRSLDTVSCQTPLLGDCNPHSCHGTCEGRYARFWDTQLKVDRTVKSCRCVQEAVCSLVGMNTYAGCRPYNQLPPAAQRYIRLWTMSEREKLAAKRQSAASSSVRTKRYWDRLRHEQMLNSNSRFCCRTARSISSSAHCNTVSLTFLLLISFCGILE